MSKLTLDGRTAIVTGGAGGIGTHIAATYAEAGANVVIASRNKENLDKVAADIQNQGGKCLTVATDITVPDQVDNMVKQTMDSFGRIDILVNNAGAAITFKNTEDLSPDEWDATVTLNLTSPFLCSTAVGRIMIQQQGGKIINLSSAAGLRGFPFMAHYCAAKRGVISLTESLASGWAKYNINVNCIAPGLTSSEAEIQRGSIPPKERKDGTPVPRLLYPPAPENIAELALFLASAASDHITGELMVIRSANN